MKLTKDEAKNLAKKGIENSKKKTLIQTKKTLIQAKKNIDPSKKKAPLKPKMGANYD